MASMKDALEECFLDRNAWLKYLIFAIPLYFTSVLIVEEADIKGILALAIPTVIFFLGFSLMCTYNVRKGNNFVLPSFNIFKTFWLGLKCTLAVAPFFVIGYFIAKLIVNLITGFIPEGNFANIFNTVIYLVFSSFGFTSYILYSRRFAIFDAYNVVKIMKYSVDVLIAMLVMLLLLALVDVLIVAPVTYIIWLLVGIPSYASVYAWSVIAALNIAMIGHYLAQIDYEVIPFDEDEQKTI